MTSVDAIVHRSVQVCLDAWEQLPDAPPAGLPLFSIRQQRNNERRIEQLLHRAAFEWDRRGSLTARERALLEKRTRTAMTTLLLKDDDPSVEQFMNACSTVGRTFTRMALEFDPELPDEDIFQALRNQWVFNSIQEYLGLPVSATSSSFAYSMLYPYTDNTIDRANEGSTDGMQFLSWLSRRLQGVRSDPCNRTEGQIDRLIGMIEDEYPRQTHPQVHAGLMAIHSAQVRSLSLRGALPTDQERTHTRVTIEKGGTSVLADGLLAAGSVDDDAAEALFIYGVLLQFIDDLQDLRDDGAAKHSTVFTRASEAGDLDARTYRLLSFGRWSDARLHGGTDPARKALCGLISRSCCYLILEAVARQRHYYSKAFLDTIEPCMPLPLAYLGELKTHVSRHFTAVHADGDQAGSQPGAAIFNAIRVQDLLTTASDS
jgi:hypothetical protein